MIIQREKEIHLWGTADSDEAVTVLFQGKKYATVADKQGSWSLFLPPLAAGGPYSMQINEIIVNNIMVG
ncbi:MAG TPA: sialate O-acetylesterase, partial [Proteiniphilum sp.]|nr:sialate O-acetylesterase [Proteiniphilum sp.]